MSKSTPILKIKNDEGQWVEVPAIKGASVDITAESTEREIIDTQGQTKTQNGQLITITRESGVLPATSTFYLWDGMDGTGTINSIDSIGPADGSTNVNLYAVRYVSQSLTDIQKNQVLANIGAASASLTINNKALSSNITLTAADVNAVPNSCTINEVALTANPTLGDIGAVPTTRTINGQDLSDDVVLTVTNISGAVPTSRTINNKALSSNINLNAADVGAVPVGRSINGQTLNQDIQTHIKRSEIAIPTSAWISDNTYNVYPYRGTISIPGVTSAMVPNVIFSLDQIESGNFSPIVETDTDAVYIYAESLPTDTVTIPVVICFI